MTRHIRTLTSILNNCAIKYSSSVFNCLSKRPHRCQEKPVVLSNTTSVYRFPLDKNDPTMKCLPTAFVFAVMLAIGFGQSRNEPFAEKPGSCPPALPVQICSQSCFSDSHCQGIGKCCSTSCGGTVCSRPVTMRQTVSPEKPGSCPAEPKGRWVCSPTCSVDSDCRGTSKCCKNRCGALACQKPDVELIESVDFSVVPLPEDRYNVLRNPYNVPRNPYVPRNPNVSPYYFYDRK